MVIELIGAVLRPLHHLLHSRTREDISAIEMEGEEGEKYFLFVVIFCGKPDIARSAKDQRGFKNGRIPNLP